MSAVSFAWERPRSAPLPALPAATFIFWGAALHAAVGLAASGVWVVTGNAAPFELFRNYPGAIFLVELAAVQFRLTVANLANSLHVYPTMGEGLRLCAQGFDRDVSMLSCCAE